MNIYNDAVSADIKNVDIVSDHHMLLAKFMRGCIMPHHITIPKITPSSRILYEYEKLTETAKKNMNQLLTQELDIINSQFHLKSLNDEWSNIKMAILNIKNQLIPSKEIKLTTHDDSNSFKNLVLYPIIRYFITLRQKFKKPFGLQHIKKNWYCITSFRKSGVLFEADWVWNSMSRQTIKSRTPLEADYGISKIQNLEADWYFEGLEFRGGLAWNLEADWYFEGPEFKGGLVWNSKRTEEFQSAGN
ncbi:endonuclease/exonuclease/phosphatase [Rhizophagus clarus]|uniref:Endonuclease/exonuclease/phosphatase n=1 Tax=Rhizophagus clarus TaxID=94130 RepID=A0A8H3MGJ6_9GLOM|nr:endonuclease/exonuclease/phosphatase [Rhizophagus clarus]